MASHLPIRKTVLPEIPDKLYFRIGDVARLCEVPAYVLRFWETEFPQLKPNKGGTGQRLYRRKDVELALRIKGLLYDQGYTIPGARQVFKNEAAPRSPELSELRTPQERTSAVPLTISQQVQLQGLRSDLAALLSTLSRPVAGAPRTRPPGLRPLLVLEQKRVSTQRPNSGNEPQDRLSQQNLFPRPASELDGNSDGWPEPPAAS